MQIAKGTRSNASLLKLLLVGGIASAPLFYAIAIAQVFTRAGFNIKVHAISILTLGEEGWIQSANFIVTGLLAILGAIGVRGMIRGEKGGSWGPLLIGVYGLGMIMAGLFRPDPGLSFPAGAPADMPTSMSGHAGIHSAAFFTAFVCLIAACIVLARRFAAQGERGWRTYCITTCILAPLLIIVGMGNQNWIGVIMGSAGIVAFGWVSALAARMYTEVYKTNKIGRLHL